MRTATQSLLVDDREGDVGQVEALGDAGHEVIALRRHGAPHRQRPSVQHTGFVGAAAGQQHGVDGLEIGDVRHGDEVVAAEVAAFALDAALLVALARRAELGREAPMRSEGHEPGGLLAPMPAQDLAHRALEIVIPQEPEHPAEVGEGRLVGFEEGLLCGVEVGAMEGRATGHGADREHLHPGALAGEIDPGLYQSTWASCPQS